MLNDDFGFDAPIRKKATRKPRAVAPARKKKKDKRFNISANQVARYGAIAMSATVVVGIMVNALLMQKGHHPAPLFGKSVAPVNTAVAEASPKVPVTSPQHVGASEPAATSVADVPALSEAGKTRAPLPRIAPDAHGDDPIARLLKGSAPPSLIDKGSGGKTVTGVQKALVKLGFAVKANGTFGPTTKRAIEAFERARHLPVKGELSHRIVKILAAESGVRID